MDFIQTKKYIKYTTEMKKMVERRVSFCVKYVTVHVSQSGNCSPPWGALKNRMETKMLTSFQSQINTKFIKIKLNYNQTV